MDSEIIDDESPSTLDASLYAPLTRDNLAALEGQSDLIFAEDCTDSDGISDISVLSTSSWKPRRAQDSFSDDTELENDLDPQAQFEKTFTPLINPNLAPDDN